MNESISLIIGFFASILISSGHCMLMCGPLLIATQYARIERLAFHLGRLCAYLIIGGLTLSLKNQIDLFLNQYPHLIFLPLIFILSIKLVELYRKKGKSNTIRLHTNIFYLMLNRAQIFFQSKLKSSKIFQAAVLGFFIPLMPCGQLMSFILLLLPLSLFFQFQPWIHLLLFIGLWIGTTAILELQNSFIQKLKRSIPLQTATNVSSIWILMLLTTLSIQYWNQKNSLNETLRHPIFCLPF